MEYTLKQNIKTTTSGEFALTTNGVYCYDMVDYKTGKVIVSNASPESIFTWHAYRDIYSYYFTVIADRDHNPAVKCILFVDFTTDYSLEDEEPWRNW